MKAQLCSIFALVTLAACETGSPRAAGSPFFKGVRQIQADGTVRTLNERQLSPFQNFMRARLSGGMGVTSPVGSRQASWTTGAAGKQPGVGELVLLEVEVTGGDGTEGAYAAVVLYRAGGGEFQWYEQARHEPRYDRYYHRALTAHEREEVLAFLKAHPLNTLRSAPPPVEATGEEDEESNETVPRMGFRVTHATATEAGRGRSKGGGATAVVGVDPPESGHPAAELLRMFVRLREAPGLTCSYLRAIPVDAQLIFVQPRHRALEVRLTEEGNCYLLIAPPLEEASRLVDLENADAEEGVGERSQWYTLANGAFMPVAAPPVAPPPLPTPSTASAPATRARAATQPATRPETVGGGEDPVFPLLPRPPSTSELLARMEEKPMPLPAQETWHAEKRPGHTVFTHYVPRTRMPGVPQGESLQMIIPGLEFDSAHMALDRKRQLLYVIHDGHVLALPLPASAVWAR
jgi:hypothetical protein